MTDQTEEAVVVSLNIFQRVLAIMAELKALTKDDKAPEGAGGYTYISHEAVSMALQPLLVKHGVVIFPSTTRVEYESNGRMVHARVTMFVKFVNADEPKDSFVVEVPGNALNPSDKALGAAITYAMKYAILKTFQIPTGRADDIESHNNTFEERSGVRVVPENNGSQVEKSKSVDEAKKRLEADLDEWKVSKDDRLSVIGSLLQFGDIPIDKDKEGEWTIETWDSISALARKRRLAGHKPPEKVTA